MTAATGQSSSRFEKVAVIGGGGYVGAVLVPRLLEEGYAVHVLDLFIYGRLGDDLFPRAYDDNR